uniref:Uncharacterized protein n=1 Tax=Branchiostoma floridae TaxID=7739 RepID=C3YN49_BRAFL|eukprot:XP_002602143.1 hypothetical protein BRAFLDRAFT_128465 [Branchiostoma floridae]
MKSNSLTFVNLRPDVTAPVEAYVIIIIIIMASVGNLEDAARKRKERLAALKKRAQDSKDTGGREDEPPAKIAAKEPKFRSYKPEDDQLKDKAVEPAKPVQGERLQSGEREDLAAVVNAKAVAAAQRQNDDNDDYDSD